METMPSKLNDLADLENYVISKNNEKVRTSNIPSLKNCWDYIKANDIRGDVTEKLVHQFKSADRQVREIFTGNIRNLADSMAYDNMKRVVASSLPAHNQEKWLDNLSRANHIVDGMDSSLKHFTASQMILHPMINDSRRNIIMESAMTSSYFKLSDSPSEMMKIHDYIDKEGSNSILLAGDTSVLGPKARSLSELYFNNFAAPNTSVSNSAMSRFENELDTMAAKLQNVTGQKPYHISDDSVQSSASYIGGFSNDEMSAAINKIQKQEQQTPELTRGGTSR